MLKNNSIVKVIDNTGVKLVRVLNSIGYSKKNFYNVGDIVTVSVRETKNQTFSVGSKTKALIVTASYRRTRKNGFGLRFQLSSVILLKSDTYEIIGNRIFGYIDKRCKENLKVEGWEKTKFVSI